jgi:lysophospholipase L1-like esterase
MKCLSVITLVLFSCFLTASGCTKNESVVQTIADSLSKSFLALGDSYTIGESVTAAERFPAQTVALLRTQGISVADPQYIARTGWTTADLQSAINQSTLQSKYDLVTLLIGVNDQYQGMDTAGYRTRFTQLLQKSIQLAANNISHVFVLSIPDYGVTPFGGGSAKISKEIDNFNAINKQVTLAFHVTYVDITTISRGAATDQTLTANDGLHPSGKQYNSWAMKLENTMLPVLK